MIRQALTLLAIVSALAAFFAFDLQHYVRLSAIKESHAALVHMYRAEPLLFVAGFMAIHIAALALCLPGAVLTMALAGGAIFGTALGTLIVLTSLTVGDTLGFLAAKFLIGDWVRKRFARELEDIEAEMDRNGAFYLLSLRLIAAIPYFVVNLTFGVTRMRVRTFAPVSFIGLAPATALYVNGGTRLSEIDSAADVLSPAMIVSFGLLALVPLAARVALGRASRKRPEARP